MFVNIIRILNQQKYNIILDFCPLLFPIYPIFCLKQKNNLFLLFTCVNCSKGKCSTHRKDEGKNLIIKEKIIFDLRNCASKVKKSNEINRFGRFARICFSFALFYFDSFFIGIASFNVRILKQKI